MLFPVAGCPKFMLGRAGLSLSISSKSSSHAGTRVRSPGSPDSASRCQEDIMDKDRAKGSTTNLGGKVKEGAGKVTGDAKLQSEGKLDQAKGKVQNAVGGIKDAIKGKS